MRGVDLMGKKRRILISTGWQRTVVTHFLRTCPPSLVVAALGTVDPRHPACTARQRFVVNTRAARAR